MIALKFQYGEKACMPTAVYHESDNTVQPDWKNVKILGHTKDNSMYMVVDALINEKDYQEVYYVGHDMLFADSHDAYLKAVQMLGLCGNPLDLEE